MATSRRDTGSARWLLAPAVGASTRANSIAMAALRMLVGLLWLYNVAWKRAPSFGEDSGNGVFGFAQDAVDHPVLPPFSWLVEHVVLPNFVVFGWGVLVVETALAVLLLTGAYVRVAAALGIAQSLVIGLSVAQTPGEWPWAYWMMIGIHVVLLFGAAGQTLAVDAVRAGHSARGLGRFWAIVLLVAGVAGVLRGLREPIFASSGPQLGGPDLSISLGSYNVAGAVLLMVGAAGLLIADRAARPVGALVTFVVGAAAALLLYGQLGFTQPWLGGSNTSAAFFGCSAVIGWTVWRSTRTSHSHGPLDVTSNGGTSTSHPPSTQSRDSDSKSSSDQKPRPRE